jgi:hypothetical protein
MYAPQRRLRDELNEGMTDRTYKKAVQDRGGFVEATTYQVREDLPPVWYGITEAQTKVDPFGRRIRTPETVATRPPAYFVV